MGFSVPQFELGKERRDRPGGDIIPPDHGYKPTINLHGNHSNLDHDYDPRHNLPGALLVEAQTEAGGSRRSYAAAITLIILIALIGALIALPLLIR